MAKPSLGSSVDLLKNRDGSFVKAFLDEYKSAIGPMIYDDKILSRAIMSCTEQPDVISTTRTAPLPIWSIFNENRSFIPLREINNGSQLQRDGAKLSKLLSLNPETLEELAIKIEMLELFLTRRTYKLDPPPATGSGFWELTLPDPIELTREMLKTMIEDSESYDGPKLETTLLDIRNGIARLRFMWNACKACETLGRLLYDPADKKHANPTIDGFEYVLKGTLSPSAFKDADQRTPGLGEHIKLLSLSKSREIFYDEEQLRKEAFMLFITAPGHGRRLELAVALRTYQLFCLLSTNAKPGGLYGGVFVREAPETVKERYLASFKDRKKRKDERGEPLSITTVASIACSF